MEIESIGWISDSRAQQLTSLLSRQYDWMRNPSSGYRKAKHFRIRVRFGFGFTILWLVSWANPWINAPGVVQPSLIPGTSSGENLASWVNWLLTIIKRIIKLYCLTTAPKIASDSRSPFPRVYFQTFYPSRLWMNTRSLENGPGSRTIHISLSEFSTATNPRCGAVFSFSTQIAHCSRVVFYIKS